MTELKKYDILIGSLDKNMKGINKALLNKIGEIMYSSHIEMEDLDDTLEENGNLKVLSFYW